VLDRLADLGWPVVIGNADALLIELPDPELEPMSEEAAERRLWSIDRLDERHLEQMRSWPLTVDIELDRGRRLHGFHASPHSYYDAVVPETPEEEVARLLGGTGADILAGGHTRTQWTRPIDGGLYLNPGSVGVTLDGLAHFGVVTGPWVTFHRVPYDGPTLRF
jgi:predicted phosphodiesterase